MIKQMVLVAIGLVPVTFALKFVPFLGPLVIRIVLAVWALHWIVVDAFDSARVLLPGQTLDDLDVLADQAPQPWFVRLLGEGETVPVVGRMLAASAAGATSWRVRGARRSRSSRSTRR